MRRLFVLVALVAVSAFGLLLTATTGQTAPSANVSRPVTMTCSRPVLDVGTGAQVSIGGVPWYAEQGQIVHAHEWNGEQFFNFGGRRYLYIGSVSAPAKFFIVEDCAQPAAPAQQPAPSLQRIANDTYVYQHTGYTTFFIVTD